MKEYNKKTVIILHKLGFKHLTGNLWKHDYKSIIVNISYSVNPGDILPILLETGKQEFIELLKQMLEIK